MFRATVLYGYVMLVDHVPVASGVLPKRWIFAEDDGLLSVCRAVLVRACPMRRLCNEHAGNAAAVGALLGWVGGILLSQPFVRQEHPACSRKRVKCRCRVRHA